MPENRRSSSEMASLASRALDDYRSSRVVRQLAASVLSQAAPSDPRGLGHRRTSAEMASLASQILGNPGSSSIAKTLAASVLSQRAGG